MHYLLGFEIAQLNSITSTVALFVVMLPKAHLTSHSRMSDSRWVITARDYLGHEDVFCTVLLCILATSSYLSSASVRSIPFLSFIVPIFAWNVPLVSLNFLNKSLVSPVLLFFLYFFALITEEGFLIFPCYSLELCIQMDIFFLFSFSFSFSSFLSYLKVLVRQPFCLLHFFLLKMVLITASYMMSWTSIHSSSGTLSIRSNPLNLFVTSTVQ